MDGGALARQHLAAGLRGPGYCPHAGELQGKKPDHLARCCWVPSGDGSSLGTAAFVGYWEQMSRHFSVVLLSLGKPR